MSVSGTSVNGGEGGAFSLSDLPGSRGINHNNPPFKESFVINHLNVLNNRHVNEVFVLVNVNLNQCGGKLGAKSFKQHGGGTTDEHGVINPESTNLHHSLLLKKCHDGCLERFGVSNKGVFDELAAVTTRHPVGVVIDATVGGEPEDQVGRLFFTE
eukprot:Lithocolla_globosa_v1_NODE_1659_length_2410_cov_219.469691.p2 type:complete len:156 gc:universal NODE_1659_length_2410_cov_219.469691:1436-1903(+)